MRRFFVSMYVNIFLNGYKIANYGRISNFKVSMEASCKMLPSTVLNLLKTKNKTKQDPLNFLKIAFSDLDAYFLYAEAKYDYDYFRLNNA